MFITFSLSNIGKFSKEILFESSVFSLTHRSPTVICITEISKTHVTVFQEEVTRVEKILGIFPDIEEHWRMIGMRHLVSMP